MKGQHLEAPGQEQKTVVACDWTGVYDIIEIFPDRTNRLPLP